MEISSDAESVSVNDWKKLESEHNYPSNMRKVWTYKVSGATKIQIHFSNDSETESGYDYIYLLDAKNQLIERLTGYSAISDQWYTVNGDTLKIYMTSDGSSQEYGFKVDDCKITKPAA